VFSDILDQKKNKRLREETMIKEEEKKKVLLSFKQKERENKMLPWSAWSTNFKQTNFILVLNFPLMYSIKNTIYFRFIIN